MGRTVIVLEKKITLHQTWTAAGARDHWRYYMGPQQWDYMAAAYVKELKYNGKETLLKEFHKSQFTVYTDLYNEKAEMQGMRKRGFTFYGPINR